MKLQDRRFYPRKFEQAVYETAQITRHAAKAYKKRAVEEYRICAEYIKDMISTNAKMLCLGTRNNHERDIFSEELGVKVFSQDIAEASGADYIGDFNKLSRLVPSDWDIIYSNSIDHAINATTTFHEWLKVLKPGGIMILGFDFGTKVSPSDCSSFSAGTVNAFMKLKNSIYKCVGRFDAVDYKYWVVRKLPEMITADIDVKVAGQLPEMSFLVGTHGKGLLLFAGDRCVQLFKCDKVYGITRHNDRWFASYVINDEGFIASFKLDGFTVSDFNIEIDGLSRKIHQIDFINDTLFATDTFGSKIIIFDNILDGDKLYKSIHPSNIPTAHFNSIYKDNDYLYLIAHNKTDKTKRNSEIYILNDNLEIIYKNQTNFKNAHNIFKDENYFIIHDSAEGKVYNNFEEVFSTDYFLRGLSVSNDYIVIGGAKKDTNRKTRELHDGKVFILDRNFNQIAKIDIPGTQVMEIRRVDGAELTLSNTKNKEKGVDRKIDKSVELWEKGISLMPRGTQTMSKAPDQYVFGVHPIYIERGNGAMIQDVDGNWYVDYLCSLGPIVLGHNNARTVTAVKKQLDKGITFSLMSPLEVELASLLTEVIPCAEQVRYAKNGTDVTLAAVRIARVATGKEVILKPEGHYHGWGDWHAASTTRDYGIPKSLKELVRTFTYNDLDSLESELKHNDAAAVIMEPVALEEPQPGFLEGVRDLCTKYGVLLIFDEVITGFRWALGGAQEHYDVTPDLATFGKAVANGMPLSIIAGKKQYMKELDHIFFSMTFGGEACSLAAAVETVKQMKESPSMFKHMWHHGNRIKECFNTTAESLELKAKLIGCGPKLAPRFFEEDATGCMDLFKQEMIKKDILFGALCYTTPAHTESIIDNTLLAIKYGLGVVSKAVKSGKPIDDFLEGKRSTSIFKKELLVKGK
jgi:glutamate-1-semialdehyde aminotransferase